MLTLNELALRHQTDKGPSGHNYLPVYEQYFSPLRDEEIRLVELGFWHGASAWMWHDYFPNGSFWFVDNAPDYKRVPPHSELGNFDQTAPEGLEWATQDGLVDIVIDDAGHVNETTIASFKLWWNALKPGGLYVIEDLHTSYWPAWGGSPDPGSTTTTMHFLKGLADEVNRETFSPDHRQGFDIEWIHFYRSLVFAKKTTKGARGIRVETDGQTPSPPLSLSDIKIYPLSP